MFLCRARCRPSQLRLLRPYSTPANPYTKFEKLRAYPFAFDENNAKRLLAPIGAGLCRGPILSSVLHRFLPSLQLEHLEPQRILPVYFPAWIVDAEVEAKVNYQGVERSAAAQLRNGYLPGSDYKVMSSVSLFPVEMQETTPLPWSEGLVQQHGQHITCIPYNIDPASGFKALSDLKFDAYPDLETSLSTVEPVLAVYRPVLMPLYLAQYDVEGRSCTLLLDATNGFGNVYIYRPQKDEKDEWDMVVERANQFMDVQAPSSDLWCIGVPNPWVDVETVSLPPHRDISKALEKWIQWKMSDSTTASQLAAVTTEATDSKPGIREFDVEDRDAVEEWMNIGAELMLIRRILERINEQMGAIEGDAPAHMGAPLEHLKAQEQALAEKRSELLPSWAQDRKPGANS
ncbi:hypothetical protein BKA70DRAFT_1421336 [Coprinopsis sp. MPI-PUGE-AT-0042]|nr:hypothetical protein BKA70DRAFT_1421336 [Coprinopsis sp. MPI-PUGE-AT-0042]